ncbi:MAG: hypothetical protein QW161_04405 [Candidatus Bathyarchaeia archaeon]
MPTDPTEQQAHKNACCRDGGFTQAWDTGGRGRKTSHAGESLTEGSEWLHNEVK